MLRMRECGQYSSAWAINRIINEMEAENSTFAKKRYYCEHCDEYLSRTIYFKHKQLYFDVNTKKWKSSSEEVSNERSFSVQLEFRPGMPSGSSIERVSESSEYQEAQSTLTGYDNKDANETQQSTDSEEVGLPK